MGGYNHEYFLDDHVDGEPIDGYIVGLGELIADEETLMTAFETLENVEYTVTTPEDEMYTTGTVIQFTNPSSGDIVATYICVVVGDLNFDTCVDIADKGKLIANINGKTDWEFENAGYMCAAADINNDGSADNGDYGPYSYVTEGRGYINQNVSPDFESSYVKG